MDKERKKVEEKKRLQLAKIESANFLEHGPEELTRLYRPFSMNQSKRRTGENRVLFKELNFEGASWKLATDFVGVILTFLVQSKWAMFSHSELASTQFDG